MTERRPNGIGRLREHALHAALCEWCAQPGDAFEVDVEGYCIDVVRGEQLIEVQTGNFGALRPKLARLLTEHPVMLVYPVALVRWIVRLPAEAGGPVARRRSPRKGRVTDLFDELVRIAPLAAHPHLQLQVVYTHEEELRRDDGQGSWRRKGVSIVDRRLLDVVESRVFASVADYAALLPAEATEFTCRELAQALAIRLPQARRMAYCLHAMGALEQAGKRGRERVWQRATH